MSDNLSLWKSVEKTDPAHVVEIRGKSYKGNSPKPHWIVHRATEVFGPCGIGWGFTIVDERVEDGAPGDRLHIAKVRVWYLWNGLRGEVEHIGGTKIVGKDKNGQFSDEDAAKKSVTDALIKALSLIGFAGDIFLGRWDDSKYKSELADEFSNGEDKTDAIPTKAAKSQLKALSSQLDRTGRSITKLLKHYGVERLDDLTVQNAAAAIEMLSGIADKPGAAA